MEELRSWWSKSRGWLLMKVREHRMGLIASALTILSIALAWYIARVQDWSPHELQSNLAITVLDPEVLRGRPILFIDGNGGQLHARLDLPAKPNTSVQILVFGLAPERSCTLNDIAQPIFDDARVDSANAPGGGTLLKVKLGELQANPAPDDPEISMYCNLAVEPFRETFADRKFQVTYATLSQGVDASNPMGGIIVDFSRFEGASDLRLTSNIPDPPSLVEAQKLLNPFGGRVTAHWRETQMIEIRDVFLVFIGGLLGLAASCFLEWARPYVVERSERTGS